jgi:hypothetical protein
MKCRSDHDYLSMMRVGVAGMNAPTSASGCTDGDEQSWCAAGVRNYEAATRALSWSAGLIWLPLLAAAIALSMWVAAAEDAVAGTVRSPLGAFAAGVPVASCCSCS